MTRVAKVRVPDEEGGVTCWRIPKLDSKVMAVSMDGAMDPSSSEDSASVEARKAAKARSHFSFSCRHILHLYPNPEDYPPEVKQAAAHLWQNRRSLNYAAHRQAGPPNGSSTVDSAARTLVQQRMKQAGRRGS